MKYKFFLLITIYFLTLVDSQTTNDTQTLGPEYVDKSNETTVIVTPNAVPHEPVPVI